MDDEAADDRLRRVLAMALGGLCVIGIAVLGVEVVTHVTGVIEAVGSASRTVGPTPVITAGSAMNLVLIAEALVVEPLFFAALVGIHQLDRRGSFALAIAGLVAFNLGAVAFFIFGWWADDRAHRVAAALVPLIGLPIAEVGLWALFRPGAKALFSRR